jgi:hypothetical protein
VLVQLDPSAQPRVEAWPDPVIHGVGHDPRSAYVETFWLPVLGPAEQEWLGAASDPELFRREILPRLRTVLLAEIMATAECSKASASDNRLGKKTPHVSTWRAGRELVGTSL